MLRKVAEQTCIWPVTWIKALEASQCKEEWWPTDQETPQHGGDMWLTTHTGALSKHTAPSHPLCVLASCPIGPLHHDLSMAPSCSLSECSVLGQDWVPCQSLLHHSSMSRQKSDTHTSLLPCTSVWTHTESCTLVRRCLTTGSHLETSEIQCTHLNECFFLAE